MIRSGEHDLFDAHMSVAPARAWINAYHLRVMRRMAQAVRAASLSAEQFAANLRALGRAGQSFRRVA